MHWRRKWQPTPVFLPVESQGRRSLVGCPLWGHTESDTTEAISSSSSCGHGGVGGAGFLLEDLGAFFLGVTAMLVCGPSSHCSPAVAHVLTSPSPAVTLLTPSLTSEDP